MSGRRAVWRPGASQEDTELVPNTASCGFSELGRRWLARRSMAWEGETRLGDRSRSCDTGTMLVREGSRERPPLRGSRDQARSKGQTRLTGKGTGPSLSWPVGLVCIDWEPVGVGGWLLAIPPLRELRRALKETPASPGSRWQPGDRLSFPGSSLGPRPGLSLTRSLRRLNARLFAE